MDDQPSHDKGETTLVSAQSRCAVKLMTEVIRRMNRAKKELVMSTGFGGLLQLPDLKHVNKKLTVWLMSRVDVSTRTLVISNTKQIPFDKTDATRIFGIPSEGKKVLDRGLPNKDIRNQVMLACFGSTYWEHRTIRRAQEVIDREYTEPMTRDEEDAFMIAFVVFAVSTILAPGSKHDYATVDYWNALAQPEDIKNHNWGEYVIERMLDGVVMLKSDISCKIRNPKVIGCPLFLQQERLPKHYRSGGRLEPLLLKILAGAVHVFNHSCKVLSRSGLKHEPLLLRPLQERSGNRSYSVCHCMSPRVLYLDSIDTGVWNLDHKQVPRISCFTAEQMKGMISCDMKPATPTSSAETEFGHCKGWRPNEVSYHWATRYHNTSPWTTTMLQRALWDASVLMLKVTRTPTESAGPLFAAMANFQKQLDPQFAFHFMKLISVFMSILNTYNMGFRYNFTGTQSTTVNSPAGETQQNNDAAVSCHSSVSECPITGNKRQRQNSSVDEALYCNNNESNGTTHFHRTTTCCFPKDSFSILNSGMLSADEGVANNWNMAQIAPGIDGKQNDPEVEHLVIKAMAQASLLARKLRVRPNHTSLHPTRTVAESHEVHVEHVTQKNKIPTTPWALAQKKGRNSQIRQPTGTTRCTSELFILMDA